MINSILTKNSPGRRRSGAWRARGGSLPLPGPSAPSPRRSKPVLRGTGDMGLEPTRAAGWKRPVSSREGFLPTKTRPTGARIHTRVSPVRGAEGLCPGEMFSAAGRSPRGTPVPGTRTTLVLSGPRSPSRGPWLPAGGIHPSLGERQVPCIPCSEQAHRGDGPSAFPVTRDPGQPWRQTAA